jgi:hypothetical protein
MKVRYRETGGFAGLSRAVEIDTAALPEAEARGLAALVERAALTESRRAGPPEARDLIGYEIVIESEESRTVIRFDDATVPEPAEELLAYLQRRARPIPPKRPSPRD